MVKYNREQCGKEISHNAVEEQFEVTQKREIKYIDLFSGLGAFHTAFDRNNNLQNDVNYTCVLASDIDEGARNIYQENYGLKPEGDINRVNIDTMPDFDILCAGFPCFVAGTIVLTKDGYKSIETVDISDTLMTHTGSFQRILNLQHKVYTGPLYKIKAKYHQPIECTPEHPFYVREKTRSWNNELRRYDISFNEPEWKKACDLNDTHYLGMKVNTHSIIPEFTFERPTNQHATKKHNITLDDPNAWFMMGFFVGDGWIEETLKSDMRSMNKIRFAINSSDTETVLSRITSVLPITDKKCPSGDSSDKYGCSDFVWFNILKKFGKYAHGKRIPEWVQDAPVEFVREFLAGYIASDGSVNKKGSHSITTVSENLALGVQRLYLKLGHLFGVEKTIRPKTTVIQGRTVNQRDTYRISGYTREIVRKQSSFIENGYVWYVPFKIETSPVQNVPVYNFEVEHDNSYVVDNVIVHNCQPFSIAGNKKGFEDETRGNLFYKILEIIDKKQPQTLLLENVKNLHAIHNGETFKFIKNEIEKRGYIVSYKVIDSRYYNSPQSRQRVYIICDKSKEYNFRDVKNPIVPVSSIIDNSITSFLSYEDKYTLEKCSEKSMMKYKLMNKKSGKGGRQGERVYRTTTCGPTICASSGGLGAKTGLYDFDGKIRTLTVNETLKMFGYDASYKYETLTNKRKMLFYLGNSIVVNVVEQLIADL